MSITGVYKANKKDGTVYYRASVTYKEKHISLGSFDRPEAAGASYALALAILKGEREFLPEDYENAGGSIGFDKWIMLLNLKKTGLYCKNPIYLYGRYFDYYLDRNTVLKFDADELFFFRDHRLQKRGGHLFYSDYGMQCGLLARYGVKNFAVEGRDYCFKNGDRLDFRFGNLMVINKYTGVRKKEMNGRVNYEVVIHMSGEVSVGIYSSEVEAAVAYNKAADSLEEKIRERKRKEKEEKQSIDVENNILGASDGTHTNCMGWANDGEKHQDYSDRKNANAGNRGNSMLSEEEKPSKKLYKNVKGYRNWQRNYIESISGREYLEIYENIKFKKNFKKYLMKL